ncbi:MAG TPA: aldo/keto reductase [Burkholderiales bacterium]|nr:aldo/keto reductase [Burkholderiales bacterium]
MKFRLLGRTGVHVSQLCLGTMSFGGDADESASAAMYKACRDAGINFFDTANQYSGGRSETILGGLIQGHRDELVIATKCFNPTGPDINGRGLSRRHITRAVEESLERLRTDRVEVYYLHQQDASTPLEESLRALEDLVRAGKILYPALSNHTAWQTQKSVDLQEAQGWARLQAIQPMYNLVKRQAEVEILPMAAANGIGVVPYSPAGGGLLSGKYEQKDKPATGRLVEKEQYNVRYGEEWMHETAARFAAFCRQSGVHPMSMAVAWTGSHPAITAPIIGARNVDQLQASLDSVKLEMTPELRAEISALSRTPPPATDRLEEAKPKK